MNVLELTDRIETILLARATGRTVEALSEVALGSASAGRVAKVEDALGIMRGRKEQLGRDYPFGADENVVVPSGVENCWYTVLLTLSNVANADTAWANEVLDQAGEAALPALMGPGTRVVNFAWPPRTSHDPRPGPFPEAVRWLAERLQLRVGHGYRPPRKDGGVDLVAIRPLAGSPLACPTTLVQTTLSRDIRTKSRDVDLGLWRTWLDLSPSTTVTLLVPFPVAMAGFDELHGAGVVLLDRVRVARLLAGVTPELPQHLAARLEAEWSRQKAAAVGAS